MKPITLKVDNFMCFTSMNLTFKEDKVLCFTGENGSGKSAVFEAISWALWRETRLNETDLIKIEAPSMDVTLTIILNNETYKIKRSLERETAIHQLSLYLLDKDTHQWIEISSKQASKTEEKLKSIIKFDYHAFINSSFFKQGEIESFITLTPTERKSFIAKILDLSDYDKLYHLAVSKIDSLELKAADLKQQIKDIEKNQFTLKSLKDDKQLILSKLNYLQADMEMILKEKKELETYFYNAKHIEEEQKLYMMLESKLKNDIMSSQEQLTALEKSINAYQEILSRSETIKDSYQNYLTLKKDVEILDQKELEYNKLRETLINKNEQNYEKQKDAESEYKKLSLEIDSLTEQLKEYKKIISRSASIQAAYMEFNALKARMLELNTQKEELQNVYTQIRMLSGDIEKSKAYIEGQITYLKEKQAELIKKIELKETFVADVETLKQSLNTLMAEQSGLEYLREKGAAQREIVFNKTNQKMFLELEFKQVEQEINSFYTNDQASDHTDFALKKLESELETLKDEICRHSDDISHAESLIKSLKDAYKSKKKYLIKETNLKFQLKEAQTKLKNVEIDENELELINNKLSDLTLRLENGDIDKEKQTTIFLLEEKKARLEKDLIHYERTREKLIDLKDSPKNYSRLQEAQDAYDKIEKQLPYYTMSKRVLEKELKKLSETQEHKNSKTTQALEQLNYCFQEHFTLRQKLVKSQSKEYDYLCLQQAKQQLPLLEKNKEYLLSIYHNASRELENNTKIKHYQINHQSIYSLDELEQKIISLEASYSRYNTELNRYNLELAKINEQIDLQQKKNDGYKDLHKKLEKSQKDISHYLEIANAFGQNGIQDIIIENSLPEMEEDTNELLSKLNSSLRIRLKTSKSSKKSILKDQLDVIIYDNSMNKVYEQLSGSEKFVMNLSLRIAISKLLMRSRQASLELLIMDDIITYQDNKSILANVVKLLSEEFSSTFIVTNDKSILKKIPSKYIFVKQEETSVITSVA